MRQIAAGSTISFLALLMTGAMLGYSAKHAAAAAPATSPSSITITEQDNGKSIEATKGQTILVCLASNPTTGYQWALQGSPTPLELIKSDFANDPQSGNRVGAGGIQTIQLTAKSAGTASLKLEYRRPWEKDVPAAKTFTVTVVVR